MDSRVNLSANLFASISVRTANHTFLSENMAKVVASAIIVSLLDYANS